MPFSSSARLSSANPFSFEESKICHLGKGYHHTYQQQGGLPWPKFEAIMNYTSPPSSMKQCNRSTTIKSDMILLLTITNQKQSHSGVKHEVHLNEINLLDKGDQIAWEKLFIDPSQNNPVFLRCVENGHFENIVVKGENTDYHYFLLLPLRFLHIHRCIASFILHCFCM